MAAAAAQPFPQQPPPQPQPGGADSGDAPDHGVARISFMNGSVSVRRGDSGELVDAVLNAPLSATDRLVTAMGSRAEAQLDSSHFIRLGSATEVRFSELAYRRFQVQIVAGTTSFRILRDSNAQIEISTPSVSVRPLKKGTYRVAVKADGTSEITVRSGDAQVFSPRGSEPLHAGKTMLARGAASDPEFQVTEAIPEDEFDRWGAARDRDLEQAISPRYVSPDVYGTEDLDSYGRWQLDPQYGNVWVPTVDPGWAPYQCGRWTWEDFYGWTWVGCEPWGWAPYHYGRWYWGSLGWAWYPGSIFANYYWHPALVGFFGWGAAGVGLGAGVGGGFGFGNVGWSPLAPSEAFHPWYGGVGGGVAVNNTVVRNTNITNVYRNARAPNGVTSMSAANFGRTPVSGGTMMRASATDLSRAGLVRGPLPVAHSRESTRFANGLNGRPRAGGAQNGGGQRFDPSSRGAIQSRGFRPQSQPRSFGAQRPVRISPPIVRKRSGASRGSGNGGGGRGDQ